MNQINKNDFVFEIMERSGQDILSCYHCGKCEAGCPVAQFMDISPDAVHRMIQYGRREDLLKCSSIWLCAGCETCGARCPNDIDIAKVMDVLKQIAFSEKVKGKESNIRVMHQVFLSGIKKRGRMHELSLIRDMRLKSGGLFKDLKLGINMFRLGKLSLFPSRVKKQKEIRKMFKKAGRMH